MEAETLRKVDEAVDDALKDCEGLILKGNDQPAGARRSWVQHSMAVANEELKRRLQEVLRSER